MTDNVIPFNGVTRLPIPVERVLQGAQDAGLTEVVVTGYREEDGAYYFASSEPDGPSCVWLLEKAKLELLRMEDVDDA